MAVIVREVVIPNALGLHARAAARFVRGGRAVDGKSLMGVLLLAASRGTTLTMEADGADAVAALDALAALVATGFGEGV
jgi:phosphocarrier protein